MRARGYRNLTGWVTSFGEVLAIGVEGTGSWGCGTVPASACPGVNVIEVNKPNRHNRRRRGKTDPMCLSSEAIRTHTRNLYRKLDLSDRAAAVALAWRATASCADLSTTGSNAFSVSTRTGTTRRSGGRRSSEFDLVAPSLTLVNVHLDEGKMLLGLGFDTSSPPYVLKVSSGEVGREVPWREGTYTRSANRIDLLKLLVPLAMRPQVTVLDGSLELVGERHDHRDGDPDYLAWYGRTNLNVDCHESIVFPDHRCSG